MSVGGVSGGVVAERQCQQMVSVGFLLRRCLFTRPVRYKDPVTKIRSLGDDLFTACSSASIGFFEENSAMDLTNSE